VVTGAVAWSPDGQHVALVARAGETSALCVADLEGGFRYLADLAPADTSVPMVYPPVAWSPDSQRLAFVAPMQQPSSAPLGWLRTVSDAVYVLDITAVAAPELMAETDAAVPGWQEDGAILLLAHPHTDGPVVIRRLSPGGGVDDVLDVPLKLGPGFSAQWDRANAQLLIAASGAQSNEFWLIGLGLEGGA
jgi:Tol biopolymer transport system component